MPCHNLVTYPAFHYSWRRLGTIATVDGAGLRNSTTTFAHRRMHSFWPQMRWSFLSYTCKNSDFSETMCVDKKWKTRDMWRHEPSLTCTRKHGISLLFAESFCYCKQNEPNTLLAQTNRINDMHRVTLRFKFPRFCLAVSVRFEKRSLRLGDSLGVSSVVTIASDGLFYAKACNTRAHICPGNLLSMST